MYYSQEFQDEPLRTREEIKAIDLANAKAEAAGKTAVPAMPKAVYHNYTVPPKVDYRD